jgi:cold shock CspA family protein
MGRSNETFNKKEKEKKRLKKQQDKKQKADERKAGSAKGKSLEDMMAYIDADGNITSTPPVPGKRTEIASEDIQISVPKQESLPIEVNEGLITLFNTQKGFGFIRDKHTQESIFVHVSGLIDPVAENDKVTFDTAKGPKGITAINVRKI